MLKKLYVHHFRSLQNFELDLTDLKSALLLGRNGSGKTTVFDAIEVFQKIGQGVTQVKDLISKKDFTFGDISKPIKLELTVLLNSKSFIYTLVIELPKGFREPRIKQEQLECDNLVILEREDGRTLFNNSAEFTLDRHHFGLPLISTRGDDEPIAQFREWLRDIVILSPTPKYFSASSKGENNLLDRDGKLLLDWMRSLLAESPNLYAHINDFIKNRLTDLSIFKFNVTGADEKELVFKFEDDNDSSIELNFSQLSDGEKIFTLAASLIARMSSGKPILCLWDEPDNYISLIELSHFILACRKAAEVSQNSVQIIMASHNARVINEFSTHNTFILSRSSHLLPTRCAKLENKTYLSSTLVEAFESQELE